MRACKLAEVTAAGDHMIIEPPFSGFKYLTDEIEGLDQADASRALAI